MNNVNLIGRITKDLEIRTTSSGKYVCSFCIAVDSGKNTPAYFIDCVAWEARAKNIATYFKKGDKIGIAGLITTRNYEDSAGNKRKVTEVLINSFDFCNGRSESSNESQSELPQPVSKADEPNQQIDGELPFEV